MVEKCTQRYKRRKFPKMKRKFNLLFEMMHHIPRNTDAE